MLGTPLASAEVLARLWQHADLPADALDANAMEFRPHCFASDITP